MIFNSGLKIKNEKNLDGDIEIVVTGLRPGEKLFEELLLDSKSVRTRHPLILKSIEKEVDYLKFEKEFKYLVTQLLDGNKENVLATLSALVPEWKRYKNNKFVC